MKTIRQAVVLLFIISSFSYFIVYGKLPCASAEQRGLVFSTWEGFEADKCASIWLIKRFIDKNAVIKFFPKGEIIKEGIPFDTPDAKFRRYHNMAAFESILRHYNLHDPKLTYMGKIIHDIEVNIWEKKVFPETHKVRDEINKIILNSKNGDEVIEKSCKYFDLLYSKGIGRIEEERK